ncbi:response regulator [Paenibacillus dauci]|uniref:response regulator n=1 Tax=Paenibacillus dauci TaxID=1567106 RepID=UPI0006196CB0|nr:response regulator [Paenibacillus dauci]
MHTIILVDDNMPVLNYLSHSIHWEQLGLLLKGSFSSSEEALAYVEEHPVDILVTDIGMPGMNGIELIQRIQAMLPRLQSVIISCHGEFLYAQQAVKLGVRDYLLKENLTAEQLIPVLQGICQRLDEEQQESQERHRLQEEHRRHRLLLKRKFTNELLSGSAKDERYGIQRLQHFGLDVQGRQLLPVYYSVTANAERKQCFHDMDLFAFTVENIVEEVAESSGMAIHLSKSTNEGYIWFALPQHSALEQENSMQDVMYRIIHSVRKFAKAQIVVVAGSPTPHFLQAVQQVIQLQDQCERYFYLPPSAIYRFPVTVAFEQESELFADYAAAAEALTDALRSDEQMGSWIQQWIQKIAREHYHPETVKTFMLKLAIDWQLKQQQLYQQPFAVPVEQLHRQMAAIRHQCELEEWMHTTFRALAALCADWTGQPGCRPEIHEARQYVEQHMHRLVRLEEVAEHLHLNPSYFSRLFKRETGETFIEYATRTKMQRAREWITSGHGTVEEVSRMLGYQYKSYFLKLYKLYTGHTPVKSKGEKL